MVCSASLSDGTSLISYSILFCMSILTVKLRFRLAFFARDSSFLVAFRTSTFVSKYLLMKIAIESFSFSSARQSMGHTMYDISPDRQAVPEPLYRELLI